VPEGEYEMRKNLDVSGIVVSFILLVLFTFDVAIGENETQEVPELNLSPAEEQSLKLKLVEEGLFEKAYKQEPWTEEEKKAFAYLTRPVQATTEADPEDIDYELVIFFKEEVSTQEIMEFLGKNDCAIVRKQMSAYLLRIPGGAVRLEEMFKELAKSDIVASVASNPFLLSEAQIKKNLVAVEFGSLPSKKILDEFQKENDLILIHQTDYPRSDGNKRYLFFILADSRVASVVRKLSETYDVLYAEPELLRFPERTPPIINPLPTDNQFNLQWYLFQDRAATGTNSDQPDSRDFDIDAPEGWHVFTPSSDVMIAVLESFRAGDAEGFRATHDDLDDRWWVNDDPAGDVDNNGLPGTAGDDDGDGGLNFADPEVRVRDYNRTVPPTPLLGPDGVCDAGPDGDYGFGPNAVDDLPAGPGGGDDAVSVAGPNNDPWDDNLRGPGTPNPFDDDLTDLLLARNDDDENGYADDRNGYDFRRNTGTFVQNPAEHGTAVAGLAGANHSRARLAGVNRGAQLMALHFDGGIQQNTAAIEYAVANGARVINMSFAGPQAAGEAAMLTSAYNAGMLLVGAAGNNHETTNNWPGDHPNVIEVAGTDDANRRYYEGAGEGSGFGRDALGPWVCAPGEDILCLGDDNDTDSDDDQNGTSLAAPQVSGLAALIIDRYDFPQTESGVRKVQRIIKGAVDDVDGHVVGNGQGSSSTAELGPDDLGKGRVNVFEALAPPRVVRLRLEDALMTLFEDGDLDGDNQINFCDPDIDGDDFRNTPDQNDDADRELDAADDDDDGDRKSDGVDELFATYQQPSPGDFFVEIQFNESMLVDGRNFQEDDDAIDPDVKLVLVDGTELDFEKKPDNSEWSTSEVEIDTWRSKLPQPLTAAQAHKCECVKIKISGSKDLAGEEIDHEVDAAGDQAYEYQLRGQKPDFGDAPDPPYPTLLANDGARHTNKNFEWIGVDVCGEMDANDPDDPDGEPNLNPVNTDHFDDGVRLFPPYRPCKPGSVDVAITVCDPWLERWEEKKAVVVNAWFDWENDGNWTSTYTCPGGNPANDHITWLSATGPGVAADLPSVNLVVDPNKWTKRPQGCCGVTETFRLKFLVPPTVKYPVWARFRLEYTTDYENLATTINGTCQGASEFGEVEDYRVPRPTADYGDAPDNTDDPFVQAYLGIPGRFPSLFDTDHGTNPEYTGVHHLDVSEEWLGRNPTSNTTVEPDALVSDNDLDDAEVVLVYQIRGPSVMGQIVFPVTSVEAGVRYINVLLDQNCDGRWTGPLDYIVRDLRVWVWPGTRNVLIGPFPLFLEDRSHWVRITLTKDPLGIPFWDGSIPPGGLDYGETEDHLLIPQNIDEDSPIYGDPPKPVYFVSRKILPSNPVRTPVCPKKVPFAIQVSLKGGQPGDEPLTTVTIFNGRPLRGGHPGPDIWDGTGTQCIDDGGGTWKQKKNVPVGPVGVDFPGQACYPPPKDDRLWRFDLSVVVDPPELEYDYYHPDTNYVDFIEEKGFDFEIKKVFGYPGQQHVRVPVFLSNPDSVGGWEILMEYDPTAGTVVGVELCDSVFVDDPEHYGWHYASWAHHPELRPEYFHYNLNADGHEDWVRVTGMMDMEWPQPHVPDIPPGQQQLLFCLVYDVSPLWSGREIMFDFLTRNCGDNVLSSSDGYTVWGPDTLSAPDWSCPQRPDSLKLVRLFGGAGIGIQTTESGDLNCNGVGYEVGDAIVFVNYLMQGDVSLCQGLCLKKYPDDCREIQNAASDINEDSYLWTVADLVMLLNIINDVGESKSMLPPKEPVELTLNGSKVTVRSNVELGAAYFILRCEGEIGVPKLELPEMELESSRENGELKILVYSMESRRIPVGSHLLFTIPGATGLALEKVEIADACGNPLTVNVVQTTHLPTRFSLAQNSPNPFSLGTQISYALPKTSEVELIIYNAGGQRVRTLVNTEQEAGYYSVQWDAEDDNGVDVASGVYFYRLNVKEFTSTKKMLLVR
jgi:hypothetical protein